MTKYITRLIKRTGVIVVNHLNGVKDFYIFVVKIVRSIKKIRFLHFRSIYDITISQTYFTGIGALPLVLIIALLFGATVIIQATKNFPRIGIEGYIGNLLVVIIAREMGPLAAALIVTSRSGSAVAAEIASQKLNKEIMSLELIGIDTKLYIVVPRVIAFIISIFSLILIFNLAAFLGGYLIALTTVYIPINQFFQSLVTAVSFDDLIITLIKSSIYGVMIPLICCYYGFKPKSIFEIPIFVSKAVIRTLLMLFIINAFISAMFYF
jgi:phospholipid/cholesterol/gamma-HCH transport system permease protein